MTETKLTSNGFLMPGPDLDRLVAEKVIGMPSTGCVPYSTTSRWSMHVVAHIAPLVGDFWQADGFFMLKYAEAGCHDECAPRMLAVDEDEPDPEPWSAHLHLWLIAEGNGCPDHWDHGDRYCARGVSAAHAICLASLRAFWPEMAIPVLGVT